MLGNLEVVVFVKEEDVEENKELEDDDELDELLLELLDDDEELELEDFEVELEDVLELVEVEEGVGVGVGVEEVVGVGVGVGLGLGVGVGVGVGVGISLAATLCFEGLDEPDEPEPPEELPALKTTMLAVWPLGTVTTQKLAPPAPEAWSELVTPPTPLTVGSMEHGVPLHPEPEQTTLIPNVGGVPERLHPVQIGFQPILRKVFPLLSALAPAT